MKKRILILLGMIILILGVYFIFTQAIVNSYNGRSMNSSSKNKSIENNLYIGEYIPTKKFLLYKGVQYKMKDAWAEHSWRYKTENFFFRRIEKENTVNFFIPIEEEFSEYPLHYYIITKEGITGNSFKGVNRNFIHTIVGDIDTVDFEVEVKVDKSWEHTMVIDTLRYIRK